jgi:hypothetical protein
MPCNQGDQISLGKIAQNVVQPFSVKISTPLFSDEIVLPKNVAKLYENSPNLVTMKRPQIKQIAATVFILFF